MRLPLDEATLVPCVSRAGRRRHLGYPKPPWRALCGAPMHDHWPPWYAHRYPSELPACERCHGHEAASSSSA